MRSPFPLVLVCVGLSAGCDQAATAPGNATGTDPVLAEGNGPPAESGIVFRFTNVDYGVTFTWNYDPVTQLLVHNSIHDGLEGLVDPTFEVVECVAPTESGDWEFQQVATPSGDIHDRDGSKAFHARVYDATGAPLDPLYGFPWPTCEFLTSGRLIAEGTSHVWWVDNDFYGIGGPGANAFGRLVVGHLEGLSGESIQLKEVSRFLIQNGEFKTILGSITIRPDPRL